MIGGDVVVGQYGARADHGLTHALEAAGFDQGTERENGLSADEPPAHAGALDPLRSKGLVRRLDHAGPD